MKLSLALIMILGAHQGWASKTIGEYNYSVESLKEFEGQGGQELLLKKGDKVLYSLKAASIKIDPKSDSKSLLGKGDQTLVVKTSSGGAHCCSTFYVFDLGNSLKLLGSIDAQDADELTYSKDNQGNTLIGFPDFKYQDLFSSFDKVYAPIKWLRIDPVRMKLIPIELPILITESEFQALVATTLDRLKNEGNLDALYEGTLKIKESNSRSRLKELIQLALPNIDQETENKIINSLNRKASNV